MSEQPNSPSTPSVNPPSPKPLPAHSWPLKPFPGSSGPKAAGRAKKKVELSSVRLMMAEGGNREVGMLKENRACIPEAGLVRVLGVATWDEESAEKRVRKMGKKIRQKRTTRRRGGRIAGIWVEHDDPSDKKEVRKKKVDVQRNEGQCQEVLLYDGADGLASTNPTVGNKRTGGHSSGTMSSTAGQKEPTDTINTPNANEKGEYRE